jgi:hypothetical protein
MGKGSEIKVVTAALGAMAFFVLSAALAAPPPNRIIQPRPQMQTQIQTLGQHLDLRAPTASVEMPSKTAGFPSMLHHPSEGSADQLRLPALGSEGIHARPGVQEFVQRVRHEGLPVARLFESKSALVHLGLSPKGKPGLWLVQKIH